MNFDIIEETRLNLGITRKTICEFLSVDKSTYSRWVNHKFEPNHSTIVMLCNYLDIDIRKVLTDEDNDFLN
jgi:transcriptional regulator with XRE-family HTH domain